MNYLGEFALWILPSSLLSRVCPGSERLPFTSITGLRMGSAGLRRANARSWIFLCPFGATTPQKSPKSLPCSGPNMRKKCEINP